MVTTETALKNKLSSPPRGILAMRAIVLVRSNNESGAVVAIPPMDSPSESLH
jgi:hypothetical protein